MDLEDLMIQTSDEEEEGTMPPPVLNLGPPPANGLPNTIRTLPTGTSQAPFWVHPEMKLNIYRESNTTDNEIEVLACARYGRGLQPDSRGSA